MLPLLSEAAVALRGACPDAAAPRAPDAPPATPSGPLPAELRAHRGSLEPRQPRFSAFWRRAGELGDAVVFASFYRFAYFVSREAGQRNLSVETALALWGTLLLGRFRLLDRWVAFVAATRRLGITEDTWRQVRPRAGQMRQRSG